MNLIAALLVLSMTQQGIPGTGRQPASQEPHDPCPAETPRARSHLAHFFASPAFAEVRQRVGLTKLAPGHLQRLSGAQDADVCRRLDAAFAATPYGHPRYLRTYYKGAGMYFATINQQPGPGEGFVLGHAPHVIVFSERLEPLSL